METEEKAVVVAVEEEVDPTRHPQDAQNPWSNKPIPQA